METAESIPYIICIFSYLITYSDGLTYYIPEEQPVNTFIGNIAEQDGIRNLVSESEFKTLTYSFLNLDTINNIQSYFLLNSSTSDLRIKKLLDRETICKFFKDFYCPVMIQVSVRAEVGNFFKKVSIGIEIQDINDNAPYFQPEVAFVTISEADVIGTSYLLDSASDNDSANFSVQSYQLFPTNVPFSIDFQTNADGSSSLNLVSTGKFDREMTDHYQFSLIARDSGNPPLNGRELINVTIADVNDNRPLFQNSSYSVTINESFPLNTTFLTVVATDTDIGVNALITYRLSVQQTQDIKDVFQINSTTGDLYLIKHLVFTSDIPTEVKVEAADNGIHPLSSQVIVKVTIQDSENHAPEIILNLLTNTGYASISEYAGIGAPVAHVKVIDFDAGRNGQVSCDIQNDYFRLQLLDIKEYKVVVNAIFDKEKIEIHIVTISCHDSGIPSMSTATNFTVVVLDENDNVPQFSQPLYTTVVQENNVDGVTVVQVNATDADSGENGRVSYSIIPNYNNTSHFSINNKTGLITAVGSFDRETSASYQFTVMAFDAGNPPLSSTASVYVKIGDQNDNTPNFTCSAYHFYILENQSKETILGKVDATDPDETGNGFVYYSVFGNYTNLPFQVLPDGTIKSIAELDREQISTYHFQVVAKDNGVIQLSSVTDVTVHVTDINDNLPDIIFPQDVNFVKYITYMTAPGTQILKIEAKDIDEGDNAELFFNIQGQNVSDLFKINSIGEIYTTRKMYDKDISHYLLLINVSDNSSLPKTTSINVTIAVVTKNVTDIAVVGSSIEKQNIVIVVVVVVATVVMAAAILIIIWIVRSQDQRKRKHVDNGVCSHHNGDNDSGFSSNSGRRSPDAGKMLDGSNLSTIANLFTSSYMDIIDGKDRDETLKESVHDREKSTDSVTESTNQKTIQLHRLASFHLHQAVIQSQNNSWTSQSELTPEGNREIRKHDDLHSDMSVDTGTCDSGVGGSVSDTGDSRLSQLQQLVRQSGRRGNPPHKMQNGHIKPPQIIARGCTEYSERPPARPPPLKRNLYQAKSPIHSPVNFFPTGSLMKSPIQSPVTFSHTGSPTFVTSSPTPCSTHQSNFLSLSPHVQFVPHRYSPSKNVNPELVVNKQFQCSLQHDSRCEDSFNTVHIDDNDGSTTSGSYYIENTLDNEPHPPVSDIYV